MKFDIVILGGGFAGAYCARTLASRLGDSAKTRVALVADQNILTFQPMLAEVVGASLSPLDVVNPLREFCQGVNIFRSRVKRIDLKACRVTLEPGRFTPEVELEFGHLVLGMGGVVDLSRVPGMPEHGLILKNVEDALQIRRTIIERLEEADLAPNPETARRLLTFTVVGGGYSGVEVAGQILDLVRDAKPLYLNLIETPTRVLLIHSGEHLLPDIGEPLGRYAEEQLRSRGMEIVLNARVRAVTAGKVYLQNGSFYETHTVISTIGTAPHPILSELATEYGIDTVKGRISTETTMKVRGLENLWAIGDCAAIPWNDLPACPPTAQFAVRQGKQLGENLSRILGGESPEAFSHRNLGQLASIGHQNAVAEIVGYQFSGFFAWWLWRTIYVAKLPGFQRKIRVIVDWTLDLFFPKDLSVLVTRRRESISELHLESGDVLFQQGDPVGYIYIIKSGKLALGDATRPERELSTGERLGGPDWIANRKWCLTATALEPTSLIALKHDDATALMDRPVSPR